MKNAARFALALIALAIPTLAQSVQTDFDENAEFASYTTYAWKDGQAIDGSTIYANTLIDSRIKAAVSEQLNQVGMREVPSEPDVYITYFIGAKDRTEVDTFGYNAGPRWRSGWTDVMVRNYREGTVILDIIRVDGNELVWRAYITDSITNPRDIEKKINKGAQKAFDKYPPEIKK